MGPRCMQVFGGDFWRELNIKMQLKEIWEGVEWINLAQDRYKVEALMNMLLNLPVP
jgi:hypothetical protein